MGSLNDDDIDVEDLQARLDMSMSVAQGVVSSWLKPKGLKAVRPSSFVETELKELLHRPQRLGVGAPIPESAPSSSTSDISRLKYKLGDKGRKRAREENTNLGRHTESDEEESRAGAIRKKIKVTSNEKEKKVKLSGAVYPAAMAQKSLGVTESRKDAVDTNATLIQPEKSLPPISALPQEHKKKKRKKRSLFEIVKAGREASESRSSVAGSDTCTEIYTSLLPSGLANDRGQPQPHVQPLTGSPINSSPSSASSLRLKLQPIAESNSKLATERQVDATPVPRDSPVQSCTPILNLLGLSPDNQPSNGESITPRKKKRRKKKAKKAGGDDELATKDADVGLRSQINNSGDEGKAE